VFRRSASLSPSVYRIPIHELPTGRWARERRADPGKAGRAMPIELFVSGIEAMPSAQSEILSEAAFVVTPRLGRSA